MRYEKLRLLGRGGIGEVWSARDPATDERIILKIAKPAHGQWLRREFELLSRGYHSNLVRVRDFGWLPDASGGAYVASEWIAGRSLFDLRERGKLERPVAESALLGALNGLRHLHGLGIVHGDVTPSNILLSKGGEGVLIDLSAAAPLGDENAPLAGTPGFLSPERLAGQAPAIHDDLYAVGRTFETLDCFAHLVPRLTCDRASRISSIDTVLAALGSAPGRAQHKPLPVLSRIELARDLRSRLEEDGVLWIRGGIGSGRSQALRALRWQTDPERQVWECVGPSRRWERLMVSIAGRESASIQTARVEAQLRLRREGGVCSIYVDDAHTLDSDEADELRVWVESTLPDDPWRVVVASDLRWECPAKPFDLPNLTPGEVERWLEGVVPPKASRDIALVSQGIPGHVVSLSELVRSSSISPDVLREWRPPERTQSARDLIAQLDDKEREALAWLAVYPSESLAPAHRRMHDALPWRRVAQRLVEAQLGEIEGEHFRWFQVSDAGAVFLDVPEALREGVHRRLASFYRSSRDPRAGASYTYHALRCGSRAAAHAHLERVLSSGATLGAEWSRVVSSMDARDPVLIRATLLARRGQRREALELLELEVSPSDEAVLLVLETKFELGKEVLRLIQLESLSERLCDPELRTRAELLRARVLVERETFDEAIKCATSAAERYREEADPIHLQLLAALEFTIAEAARALQQYEVANRALERALVFFRTLNDPAGMARAARLQAELHFVAGEFFVASESIREASEHYDAAAEPLGLFECYLMAAQIHVLLEHMAAALDSLRYASAYARTELQRARARGVEGQLLWRIGARTQALFLLQSAEAHPFAHLPGLLERVREGDTRRVREQFDHFANDALGVELGADVALFALDEGRTEVARSLLSVLQSHHARFEVAARIDLEDGRIAEAKIHVESGLAQVSRPLMLADLHACAQRVYARLSAPALVRRHAEYAIEGWEQVSASLSPELRGAVWTERGRAQLRRVRDRQQPNVSVDSTQLQNLLHINKRLNRSRHVKDVLEVALDAAVEMGGAELGLVLATSPKGGARLRIAAARGANSTNLPRDTARYSRTIARQVLESRSTVRLLVPRQDFQVRGGISVAESVHALGTRAVIAVLLAGADQDEGVLYLENRQRSLGFSIEVEHLMNAFSEQIAIALRNARLVADLRRTSSELERDRGRLRALLQQRDRELADERRRNLRRDASDGEKEAAPGIVGRSGAIRAAANLAQRFSSFDSTVLIQGESGTGKELFARAIHTMSPRSSGRFIGVNCAAFSEQLLESEFFGHLRGSFTGAETDRDGLFVEADGGTLFLDEVGELPLPLQAKFLRVLQEGEVRRIGETTTRKVDVRVVAATNRNLASEVRRGNFREDLLFRLNVFLIEVPPLRERLEDLPLLIEHLLEHQAQRHGLDVPSLSRGARRMLMSRQYPGNIRELQNVLSRAVALCEDGVIRAEDIDLEQGVQVAYLPTSREEHRESEEVRIRKRLAATGWNVARSARELGMSRATLYRRMKQLGLTRT